MRYVRYNKKITREETVWDRSVFSWVKTGKTSTYRQYSKWHILADRSELQVGGTVASLCGHFSALFGNVEIADIKPSSGKRSHRRQNPVCYFCRLVDEAMAL